MNRRLTRLFIVLLLLAGTHALAQEYPMLHYGVEDGLPSNNIYSTFQDSKGFLWIATDKGIARYNGIKFETFTTANGLPDNEIFFFKEDHQGRLWLATYNGELCYFKDGIFHTASNTPFLKIPFKTSFIDNMRVESDSSITIIFFSRYRYLNIKNETVRPVDLYKINDTALLKIIIDGHKLANNSYEFYTHSMRFTIDSNYNIVAKKEIAVNKASLANPNNYSRGSFNQDQRYIYDYYTIYNDRQQKIRDLDSSVYFKNFIRNIYYDSISGWLISTNHGIFINDSVNVLGENSMSDVIRDRYSNYWLSTLGNGLFCLSGNFIKSKMYKNAYKDKVMYTLAQAGHIFFVTSKETSHVYDIDNGKVKELYSNKNIIPYYEKNTSSFLIDSSYRFYDCNNGSLTVTDNLFAKQLVSHTYYVHLKLNYVFKTILKLKDEIYINTRYVILRVRPDSISTPKDFKYSSVTDTISLERIFDMAKSKDNQVWYSDLNNVYKIENGKGVEQPHFKNLSLKKFIFSGDYLIGYTQKNALILYDTRKDIFIDSIKDQNCIWGNFCMLDSVHILITTNNLYRLITLYPGSEGKVYSIRVIENPFIPQETEAICSDGTNCYFFKSGSVTAINVANILTKPEPPQLTFTFIKAGDKTYAAGSELELPYNLSKNLSLRFSTISFGSKNISYQFSAVSKGENDLWQDITGDAINLYNLGYGNHTIKLRAKSISSDYSEPIVFALYIMRPFWATWWFVILCAAAFIAVLAIVIRARISFIVKRNEKAHASEVKFMKSEYKALNALMNPHFIFNTLNNVQSLVNDNNKLAANEYLRVFADLIRQNMHNVSKELIPLQKEMDLVTNYLALEKLRFEDKLTYAITIDDNVDLSDILVPPLLIQPLVENSIKHGILPQKSNDGKIGVHIYERAGMLYIEVKDNGAGLSAQKVNSDSLHESFGLENIKTRIQQLSIIQGKEISLTISEIKNDAGNVGGTIVTIVVPLAE